MVYQMFHLCLYHHRLTLPLENHLFQLVKTYTGT